MISIFVFDIQFRSCLKSTIYTMLKKMPDFGRLDRVSALLCCRKSLGLHDIMDKAKITLLKLKLELCLTPVSNVPRIL